MKEKILFLTDRESNQASKGLKRSLSSYDCSFLTGKMGKKIFEDISGAKPDLLLLDLQMTDHETECFLKELSRDRGCKYIPVIFFLSGKEEEKIRIIGKHLLHHYIVKPVDREELQGKIEISLKIKNLHRDVDSQKDTLTRHLALSKELADFSRRINCLDLPEIAKTAREKLPSLLQIKNFSLYLYNKEDDSLRILAHNYKKFDSRKKVITEASQHDEFGIFIADKNKFLMEDRLLILPLSVEKTLLGILILKRPVHNEFDEKDILEASRISQHMASAIRNCQMYQEIENISVTDGLTGIYNYRYFQERLSEELKRVKRSKSPCSVVLMDIDHFKKINDTYGHLEGDGILVEFVDVIRIGLREFDIAARYGGEEFVLLLPDTRLQEAVIVAERTRKRVLDHDFSHGNIRHKVTVSLGVATYHFGDKIGEKGLIGEADKYLYKAKQNGRNRVCYPEYVMREPEIKTAVTEEEKKELF